MKTILAGLLLATTACAPVWAADFTPATTIDAVTVYPQGADVVRVAKVDVPAGAHRIILEGLPASIDPQSIRVEGATAGAGELAISSVDTRSTYTGEGSQDAQRKALEDEITALTAERGALDMAIADATQQRTFLLGLADKSLAPSSSTELQKTLDVDALDKLMSLVGQKLAGLAADIQKAQARQRDIDVKVQDLSSRLGQMSQEAAYRTQVTVNVDAATAVTGALRVSYRVGDASWTPYYDARLSIGAAGAKPALDLVRRAEVTQSTGEAWQDVALTLSTARPGGATAAPDVTEQEISPLPPPVPQSIGAAAPVAEMESGIANDAAGGEAALARKVDKNKDVQQTQAVLEMGGFQANYAIPGRVSVDNGGQAKKVRISSSSADVTLAAVTAPRLDPSAYLTAKFSAGGEGPQLPGPVYLYRDGVYVGQGSLPLLNPGEEAKLGFGADDLVKVERKEVKRLTGEEGILTSSTTEERAWDITVKNLHGFALPVTVMDRVPFTTVKDVTIVEIPGMTPPTTRDVEKKRGVLAWDITLEPKAETTLKTGYKISWPEGVRVGISD